MLSQTLGMAAPGRMECSNCKQKNSEPGAWNARALGFRRASLPFAFPLR